MLAIWFKHQCLRFAFCPRGARLDSVAFLACPGLRGRPRLSGRLPACWSWPRVLRPPPPRRGVLRRCCRGGTPRVAGEPASHRRARTLRATARVVARVAAGAALLAAHHSRGPRSRSRGRSPAMSASDGSQGCGGHPFSSPPAGPGFPPTEAQRQQNAAVAAQQWQLQQMSFETKA